MSSGNVFDMISNGGRIDRMIDKSCGIIREKVGKAEMNDDLCADKITWTYPRAIKIANDGGLLVHWQPPRLKSLSYGPQMIAVLKSPHIIYNMSAVGIFRLIANDGAADRMLQATELLTARMRNINHSHKEKPYKCEDTGEESCASSAEVE